MPKASLIQGHPTDMKGVFIRRFRWGIVDTLDPQHCDFAALRTAILSTYVKAKVFPVWSEANTMTLVPEDVHPRGPL